VEGEVEEETAGVVTGTVGAQAGTPRGLPIPPENPTRLFLAQSYMVYLAAEQTFRLWGSQRRSSTRVFVPCVSVAQLFDHYTKILERLDPVSKEWISPVAIAHAMRELNPPEATAKEITDAAAEAVVLHRRFFRASTAAADTQRAVFRDLEARATPIMSTMLAAVHKEEYSPEGALLLRALITHTLLPEKKKMKEVADAAANIYRPMANFEAPAVCYLQSLLQVKRGKVEKPVRKRGYHRKNTGRTQTWVDAHGDGAVARCDVHEAVSWFCLPRKLITSVLHRWRVTRRATEVAQKVPAR